MYLYFRNTSRQEQNCPIQNLLNLVIVVTFNSDSAMGQSTERKTERRNELNLPQETGIQELLMSKMTMVIRVRKTLGRGGAALGGLQVLGRHGDALLGLTLYFCLLAISPLPSILWLHFFPGSPI